MMPKHATASSSILRRVSQFEQNQDQQPNETTETISINHHDTSIIPSSPSPNEESSSFQINNFIFVAFERFKQEFSNLYPESQLPFEELTTLQQAKQLLQNQKERIVEISKELNRSKFTAKFLEEIIVRDDKDLDILNTNDFKNHEISDNLNQNVDVAQTSTKEQYVTVITLNDSAYGEIQKISPKTTSVENCNKEQDNGVDIEQITIEPNNNTKEIDSNKINDNSLDCQSKQKSEPIYSNTLETQKLSDKASKKRPPTPPRKPKLPSKSLNNANTTDNSSYALPLTKSESYSSRSQYQRKFNGPLQQIDKVHKESLENQEESSRKNNKLINSRKNVSSNKKKTPYLRTFSLEQNAFSNTNVDGCKQQPDQIEKKSVDESIVSNDDNIYDIVAPDSDCEDKPYSNISNDEENETSSQEMLSRSSSTDELSNYANIDYFLRKNSLGRSNSNIPARLASKKVIGLNNNVEESENENETNMSSIKSSDYDHFGSSDNILRSFQAPTSHSTRSFNSISTNSSTSGSSLRVRNAKLLNKELSESYPPNLSTFTSPIRDKNHQEFIFKPDTSFSEKDESSIYSDGSEFNLLDCSKNASSPLDKSSSETDYYAYTDILDSNNLNDNNKLELHDESVCLEDKSISKFDQGSSFINDEDNKRITINNKLQESDYSLNMQWNIVRSIIDSETIYLDCLNTLNKYKKAFETASKGENALLSMEDLNTIFYRIPDLFDLHNTFLKGLKKVEHGFKLRNSSLTADSKLASKLITKQSIGELFNKLAEKLSIYSDFLRNYSKAIETANRCGANNARFFEIIKSIKVASAHGQFSNLVDLLHEPVARLQKNALVLHDLLKYSENEDEQLLLKNALRLNQKFLNELNLDATRRLFMTHDKFKRRLVKESFIIESGDRRKLRHLFLFNDVIVSAKYKASSKQKFTFELRWFQMLNHIVLDSVSNHLNLTFSESSHCLLPGGQTNQILSTNHQSVNQSEKESKECLTTTNLVSNLKSRAFSTRLDLYLEEKRKGHSKLSDRLRKKISELESELVLYLPQLKFSFHVKNNPNKCYVFYLSSEYERNCWIDAIKTLQQHASSDEHANVQVLQKWIESCRKNINVNLGSFLLRTNKDETLRYGDLHMRIIHLENFHFHTDLFIVIEIDSFGHYFKRAVARYLSTDADHHQNKYQDFLIELEGSQILRFLLYEKANDKNEMNEHKSHVLKGKATLELTSSCTSHEPKHSEIQIGDYTLCFETRYIPWNSIMELIPPNKIYGMFGVNISQVCKKEKSQVPYLILSCIIEVERRGLKEVGIYRVSGLSSEVQKLKKAFETNPRDACYLIRETDIHSVTGLLKLYLRELPESLFTNDMYQKYFEARDLKNQEEKEMKMTSLLSQLIEPNQSTVIRLIEHLVLVNRYEDDNKMSLNNLATVFGPTMLRTNSTQGNKSSNSSSSANSNIQQGFSSNVVNINIASLMINTDLFTASTIDVMAQADILYFFLRRKSDGFSLTSVDQEETSL